MHKYVKGIQLPVYNTIMHMNPNINMFTNVNIQPNYLYGNGQDGTNNGSLNYGNKNVNRMNNGR